MNIYVPPRLSPEAIALIKHFEGCFLEAYRDPVGVWTIGYGHTAGVKRGRSITLHQAEDLLMEDLDIAQADVRHSANVRLNENEFGALVSLAFNIGGSTLAHSTLMRTLNKGNRQKAAAEFERFVKGRIAGRRVTLKGLQLRRQAEREFFEAQPGTLVQEGKMVLAGRTIPVEHAVNMGPPTPPPHAWYPPSDSPAPGPEPDATGVQEPVLDHRVSGATLATIGAGAAVGAVPASNAPAAQGVVSALGDVWDKAGGSSIIPPEAGWLRWAEAIGSGFIAFFREGRLAPLLDYLSDFIRSHEGLIVFLVTIALIFYRISAGGIFVSRRER